MTWTYSADPSSHVKDQVRWLVQDTIDSDPQVQDEEIYFVLGQFNQEPYRAAIEVAGSLAARYVREAQSVSKSVGGLSLSKTYGDLASKYERLANDLRLRARSFSPPVPSADPNALGAELRVGEFDRYSPEGPSWPNPNTGVSTQGEGGPDGYEP